MRYGDGEIGGQAEGNPGSEASLGGRGSSRSLRGKLRGLGEGRVGTQRWDFQES